MKVGGLAETLDRATPVLDLLLEDPSQRLLRERRGRSGRRREPTRLRVGWQARERSDELLRRRACKRQHLFLRVFLPGMVVRDGEAHQLVEGHRALGVDVEQARGDCGQLQALADHGGGDAEGGGDLLLAASFLTQGLEGAELVEGCSASRSLFSARLCSSAMPSVRMMQGTGAVLFMRFCATSSSSARKRRPPTGTSNRPVSWPSASSNGRTVRLCSSEWRTMLSASASTDTPALTRRTLAWLSTSLLKGMSCDRLGAILGEAVISVLRDGPVAFAVAGGKDGPAVGPAVFAERAVEHQLVAGCLDQRRGGVEFVEEQDAGAVVGQEGRGGPGGLAVRDGGQDGADVDQAHGQRCRDLRHHLGFADPGGDAHNHSNKVLIERRYPPVHNDGARFLPPPRPNPVDVHKTPLLAVFDSKQRLEVPLFQRQYVWDEDHQWLPLWEDIERKFTEALEARENAPVHFLGAMVLDQKQTPTGHVVVRQVIDGQQRLTTLQIFLSAYRDFCRSQSCDELASECEKFLFNTGMMANPEVDRFKVWPTQLDRSQFADVVQPGHAKNC